MDKYYEDSSDNFCDGNRVGTLKVGPKLKVFPTLKPLFQRHTQLCGGSLGIYFILHDVSVIIVHNGIVNFNWGSVYLDAYNEQDYRQVSSLLKPS